MLACLLIIYAIRESAGFMAGEYHLSRLVTAAVSWFTQLCKAAVLLTVACVQHGRTTASFAIDCLN